MSPGGPWLARHARLRPDQPALIFAGRSISYRELEARAVRLAARLNGLGVGPGDRIAVLHSPDPLFVELIHALVLLDVVLAPLSTRLAAGELRPLVEELRPALLIHGPSQERVCADLRRHLPNLSFRTTDSLRDLPEKPTRLAPSPRLDRDHSILYTSGSTGRPKGVRLGLAQHRASAAASARRLGTQPGDRWLLCLPLYHIGGLAVVMRAAIDGMTVVLEPPFDAAAVHEALWRYDVTHVSLVPTMLDRLLAEPLGRKGRRFPSSLRTVLLGGGRIPRELIDHALAEGIPAAPSYGMTETASQVATLPPRELARHPDRVGRPLPGVHLRICDARGRELPPGEAGEIQIQAPQVMRGYLDRPRETEAALADGWLHTGDLGRVDPDGYLTVLSRRSDRIVTGGENVSPAEVEAVLREHPLVRDARVIGHPDRHWGEQVHALIVPVLPARPPRPEELNAHCRERLASFKLPRHYRFVTSLPRRTTNKLLD